MKKLFVVATLCMFAGVYSASAQSATKPAPARHADIQKAQHVEQVAPGAPATKGTGATAATEEHPAVNVNQNKNGNAKACCKKGHTCDKKATEATETK